MNKQQQSWIREGQACLGIELGSTRIKAVLIGLDHQLLATGSHAWENQLTGGIWTYDLKAVEEGLTAAYQDLAAKVQDQYGLAITRLSGIGVSAMMHGYLAFDENDRLLVPFRTWRNTMTQEASRELSELFDFSIPQRWSIAHLYQAILSGEGHVRDVRHITTLAGYVHFLLTGEKVLGLGDASGMFPLGEDGAFDSQCLAAFNAHIQDRGMPWRLEDLLPRLKTAGEVAGRLTPAGAALLDPAGHLQPGAPLCPPEGDAGTGMVATNAVSPHTGNVSAGTSIFAMIVLEKQLKQRYPEIDIVVTPDGSPVAMVHCNNGTTDLNTWVGLLADCLQELGLNPDQGQLYQVFFAAALKGDRDAGGILTCGYHSGEHITGFEAGRPLLLQLPDSTLSLANLARSILYTSLATLAIGMEVLAAEEVRLERILGHGGLYKEGDTGQRFTAAALNTPVSVMETANEGGAWGIALLAAYMSAKAPGESLGDYLEHRVFSTMGMQELQPDPQDVSGFAEYLQRYKALLQVERAALDHLGDA